jgi:hypothetical protein
LLQKIEASKIVPACTYMHKAVMILGVLKVTSAEPTSFSKMNPPFFSFRERDFVVMADRQTRSKLNPYTLAMASTITLQEYPKYF